MGGGHHVDWSHSQQSQCMADYQEAIQRSNLYKPSVSGQRKPSRTSASRQWLRSNANKAKAPCITNCWRNPSLVSAFSEEEYRKKYSGSQVEQGSRHIRRTCGATEEPRAKSSQVVANNAQQMPHRK